MSKISEVTLSKLNTIKTIKRFKNINETIDYLIENFLKTQNYKIDGKKPNTIIKDIYND